MTKRICAVFSGMCMKPSPKKATTPSTRSSATTYITNYNNARSMICKIDRDELMQVLVREYLFKKEAQ